LIEAVPGLRRIAILADTKATRSPELQALQEAASVGNIEVLVHQSPPPTKSRQPSTRRTRPAPQQ